MRTFARFLTYNNIVPIALSFVLLGAGSTYAATNPEVILDKEQKVISIDNTYISDVNFKKYSPSVEILQVTEDDDTYYIEYRFSTISLVDYVWQDVVTDEVLEVKKARLGKYRDLGLFVTEQLNEKIEAEEKRLAETQIIEKKQPSQKKVATKYKGIVGGFLDEKVTTLASYKPVVKPPKPKKEIQTFAPPDPNADPKPAIKPDTVAEPSQEQIVAETIAEEPVLDPGVATQTEAVGDIATSTPTSSTTDANTNSEASGGGSSEIFPNDPPTLTILGDNPVRIAVGGTYTDLGAAVTDDHDTDLSIQIYVDGVAVTEVTLDTSTTTVYTITYESLDSDGALTQEERLVEVFSPDTITSEHSSNPDQGDSKVMSSTETTTGASEEASQPPSEPNAASSETISQPESAKTEPSTSGDTRDTTISEALPEST